MLLDVVVILKGSHSSTQFPAFVNLSVIFLHYSTMLVKRQIQTVSVSGFLLKSISGTLIATLYVFGTASLFQVLINNAFL